MTAARRRRLLVARLAAARRGVCAAPAVRPLAVVTVSIRGLEVEADVGVLPDEIGRPQPLVVSVTVGLLAAPGDRLAQTLDYREVAARAQALGAERIGLIETFARRLAEACLDHPAAAYAEVVVEKPQALAGALASARIVLSRGAGGRRQAPH